MRNQLTSKLKYSSSFFYFGILAFSLSACGKKEETPPSPAPSENGTSTSSDSGSSSSENSNPPETPPPSLPSDSLPVDWFDPPADLIDGTASGNGDEGFVLRDDDGFIYNPAPDMIFPIKTGPAFLNSQTMMPGGFGANGTRNPNPGDQNNLINYQYPWKDNFCETRSRSNGQCNHGTGHQGQDIRPATCENGKYIAVAPEQIRIRNVGSHGVNAFGLETGILYTFLHLDRPLADNLATGQSIKKNDIVEAGSAIGAISNKTSPDQNLDCYDRCTTLHLHFEMWAGAEPTSNSFSRGVAAVPLPPYASLVDSYLRLVDSQPDGEDWVNPRSKVPISACARP